MTEEYNRLEIKTLDMLNDYMRLVYNHLIKKLGSMVDLLIAGSSKQIELELDDILKFEAESIEIKKEILDELSEAEGMMARGDLMRLTMLISHLIDSSTGLGYRIQAASIWEPDKISIEKMKSMMTNVDNSVKLVRESVFLLPQNAKKSIDAVRDVENIEREIDGLQRDFIQHIYDLNLDFKTTLRIRDFIIRLEEISDIAADTADAIRILAVSRYGIPR
ncbi:MAG: DUF47 domain-containing protein [Candidatus Helarchaeota archaeon]